MGTNSTTLTSSCLPWGLLVTVCSHYAAMVWRNGSRMALGSTEPSVKWACHLPLSSLYSQWRSQGIHRGPETEPRNLEKIWSFPFPSGMVTLEKS